MSHWRRQATEGAEFWISCKWPLTTNSRFRALCSSAASMRHPNGWNQMELQIDFDPNAWGHAYVWVHNVKRKIRIFKHERNLLTLLVITKSFVCHIFLHVTSCKVLLIVIADLSCLSLHLWINPSHYVELISYQEFNKEVV